MTDSINNKGVFVYYENGNFAGQLEANNPPELIKLLNDIYSKKNIDWKKDIGVRIYQINIIQENKNFKISIIGIGKNGKLYDEHKSKQWHITLDYDGHKIDGDIKDKTDQTIYVLWEVIQGCLKIDFEKEVNKINFTVEFSGGEITQKAKLVLFFSKKENCGKLWTYTQLRQAMDQAGLAMVGRGIEGERPREFRYAMGYSFITNEKDKDVPDGSCMVKSPFPFGKRNERRVANLHLEKQDWSELLGILNKDAKRKRCGVCGLFEGETNKIGQKTKFQQGHYLAHLSGGNVSKDNLFDECQYCNTEQLNIYDIDPINGKKIWNFIPAISKRDYKTKLDIYNWLKSHLKKEDLQ